MNVLVVDNKFVLLDFPRTGNTSITRMFERHFNTEWYRFFVPMNMIPEYAKELPRIAFVRDPVDWYTSLFGYYYTKIRNTDNVYRHVLRNHVDPDSCIKLLLDPTNTQIEKALDWYTPQKILDTTMRFNQERTWNVPPEYWQHYKSLYSWRLNDLFGNRVDMGRALLLRYEEMDRVLPQVMIDLMHPDIPVFDPSEVRQLYTAYVKTATHENPRPWKNTLQGSTIDLIRHREEYWLDEFDYAK